MVGGAGSRREAQLVADARAEILGELDADDDVGGADVEFAGDDLLGERDHPEVGLRFDARDRDRLVGVAAHGKAGAGNDRRDGDHVRHPLDLHADLLPLVDRTQLLRPRLHLRRYEGRLTRAQRPRHLVGRQDHDRRLVVERAADDVGLQARQQRRHEHDDAAAKGDAEDDEQRLHQAFAHEAEGHDPLEKGEAVHDLPSACARHRHCAHALSGLDRRIRRGNEQVAGGHAFHHLDVVIAPQPDFDRLAHRAMALDGENPGLRSRHIVHGIGGNDHHAGAARDFDVHRYRHVLPQVVRRIRNPQFDFHRAAQRIDARD